jgi:steroid delta-isomerase-like uncharacterized protein
MSTTVIAASEAGLGPVFVEEWAARWLAAWNGHDVETMLSMVTEDVVWDDPALPETYHGREGFRRFVTATFHTFPDVQIEELEPPYLSPTHPKVLTPYRFNGTMLGDWEPANIAATGARVSFEGVDHWEFRDGLLARYDTSYDLLDVSRQMGLLPPIGSRADRLMTRLQHLQARAQRRKATRRA